ncbi:phospholipid scramblase 3-like [Spea bombifrons]|uniref:phospholipid scramblase 3-like n=1 Tax=Spea bombifrons TaxID=233779 RepID=UPI00234AB3D8|nr:phospholipid scramblase 3-like [Spea bombifrons]XP_053320771.1 phospholipid scramblase 3-like [Spea bombifrons]
MAGVPVTPPGLECLLQVGSVRVKQTRDSMFQNYCTYDILSGDGQLLYRAEEERACCGPRFNIHIRDLQGYEVLNLLLPSSFCSWETQMQVLSVAGGMLLGYIDKNWASMTSSFTLLTPQMEPVLKVRGPGWGAGFMSDAHFKITLYKENSPFGVITRVWKGMLSINDSFEIQFPLDLDVKLKALLVSCAVFIDFLYYERNRDQNN